MAASPPIIATHLGVSSPRGSAGTPPASSSTSTTDVLAQLDELLFAPRSWFAIDADNRKVPGVFPGTVEQGLALVGSAGSGPVATFAGRLRREVAAVDIDAAGEAGAIAADTIVSWCRRRGLWHLVRPSGGAYGRAHVLVVPGTQHHDLVELVAAVRRDLHLRGSQCVLLQSLRPLSAPHRRTGPTPPPAGAVEALEQLRETLDLPLVRTAAVRRQGSGRRQASTRAGTHPLVPARRRRRGLPATWAAYLAGTEGGPDDGGDRSALELEATFQLVITGHDEPAAWAAIEASAPTAFTKAKSRGRGWWWTVWNAAVTSADAWREEHVPDRQHAPVLDDAGVEASEARRQLTKAWARICRMFPTWDHTTRHTDLEVAASIVEILHRRDVCAAQIAERSLWEACALGSRATVKSALLRLQAAGVIDLQATYVPGTTDTSNTIALLVDPADDVDHVSVEVEGNSTAGSLIGPHSVSHPLPARPSLPQRRGLPTLAHASLLWVLAATDGLALEDLTARAGLLRLGQAADELTRGQRRSLLGQLRTLAAYDLVQVDAAGSWRATDQVTAMELEVAGGHVQRAVEAQVAAEREEFRNTIDPGRRRERWLTQQAAAIALSRKAQRARQTQWWATLPEEERATRRDLLQARFDALDPASQARQKQRWAQARARAGETERDRYDNWRSSMPALELMRVAGERAARFAVRPPTERRELAMAWALHRREWNLPNPSMPSAEPANGLPEAALLTRAAPDAEQLVLFDIGARSGLTAAVMSA